MVDSSLLPDMTGLLLQYCQAHSLEPTVTCDETENHRLPDHPEHRCTIKIMKQTISAVGSTKKLAKKDASRSMLKALTGLGTDAEILQYVKEAKNAEKRSEGKEKKKGTGSSFGATTTTHSPVHAEELLAPQEDSSQLLDAPKRREKGKGKLPLPSPPSRENPAAGIPLMDKGKGTSSGPWKCISCTPPKEGAAWATDLLKAVLKARKAGGSCTKPVKQNGLHVVGVSCTVEGIMYEAEFSDEDRNTAQALACRDILLQLFPTSVDDQQLQQASKQYIDIWTPLPQMQKQDPNGPNICVGGWAITGAAPSTAPEIIYSGFALNECEIDAEMPSLLAKTCEIRYGADPTYAIVEEGRDGSKWEVEVELHKFVPGIKGVGRAMTQSLAKVVAAEDLMRKFFPARTRNAVKQSAELELQCRQALETVKRNNQAQQKQKAGKAAKGKGDKKEGKKGGGGPNKTGGMDDHHGQAGKNNNQNKKRIPKPRPKNQNRKPAKHMNTNVGLTPLPSHVPQLAPPQPPPVLLAMNVPPMGVPFVQM